MMFFTQVKSFLNRINTGVTITMNTLWLVLIYMVGIGITSIVATVVGKTFLTIQSQHSNWKKYSASINEEKPY